ncbi:gamma-glutamyl transpeptidase [Salpingoeca rosetta]|uniref:Gamma-glutamyl transpeptidase n=1 Tax=Salpingoeca rosetta (strain ATCC 50818 / BSB-021) TaxID=946362 RepID=F2UFF6_SALR5|nr:gamma-glutamyl transpeptidase [Salpingoeca rosetta]EGD75524.1 gamma-glutamyl transpeptidase [Salpingoeca rosetta]|eukprot:XP_004991981.1 gamma-glutamyl transpeptidase [Salpingoeca rosetta]
MASNNAYQPLESVEDDEAEDQYMQPEGTASTRRNLMPHHHVDDDVDDGDSDFDVEVQPSAAHAKDGDEEEDGVGHVVGKPWHARTTVRRFIIIYGITFICAVLVLVAVIVANSNAHESVGYKHGAVAADVGICSEIGRDILKKGGNAVDAAISTTLCLGVVNGQSSGIGGGGFMLVHNGTTGASHVIDFREMAPAAATSHMYRAFNACLSHDAAEQELCASRVGGLASGVPGELRGLEKAWQLHGRLSWYDLVMPSVELARNGFKVSEHIAASIEQSYDRARPALRRLFEQNGRLLKEGDTMKRLKLADTLEKVARDGASVFYEGEIAQGIIEALSNDSIPGIMTLDDLRNYTPVVRDALTFNYEGFDLFLAPAPASGSVLGMILNILDNYNLTGTTPNELTWHRIIESFRFAYAQRTKLADPCCGETCTNTTLCDRVTSLQQEMLNRSQGVHWHNRITNVTHHDPKYYGADYDIEPTPGTTHLSVVDSEGNAVGVTSTVNLYWGSKVLTKHGILMNNEMDDFATPGVTNAFGVQPSPANYVGPGKRPLSSSAPCIAVKNGSVRAVAGASGGTKITTATAQVLLNMLNFGMLTRQAVDSPRVHDQLLPDVVAGERAFPNKIRVALEARGHNWVQVDSNAVTQAIYVDTDGIIYPASDKRKGGHAAGY